MYLNHGLKLLCPSNYLVIRLGKDEAQFLEEYPEAKKGFKALLNAIRKAAGSRRISKYGTPEERDRILQEAATASD